MSFCGDLCSGVIGNFRNCMTTPLTSKRIFIIGGVILVIILIIIIICVSTGNSSSPEPEKQGKDALSNVPFVYGNGNVKDYLNSNFSVAGYNYSELYKEKTFGAVLMTTSVDCKSQYKDSVSQTIDQLDFIRRLVSKSSFMEIAYSAADVRRIQKAGSVAVILSVGGGHSIDSRLSLIRNYYDFGVRLVTLASSGCSTPWVKSSAGKAMENITKNGNDFLEAAISEMNRLGIVIDVEGSNKSVQAAVIQQSKSPVILRGAAMATLLNNTMNIDSDIAEKLKTSHGLIMLSLDCDLISRGTNCTKHDFKEQLQEAKSKLGVSNIGIGGVINQDGKMPFDLQYKDFPELFNELKKNLGWTLSELEGLAGNNFLNLLEKVEENAKSQLKENAAECYFDLDKLLPEDKSCYTSPSVSPPNTNSSTKIT